MAASFISYGVNPNGPIFGEVSDNTAETVALVKEAVRKIQRATDDIYWPVQAEQLIYSFFESLLRSIRIDNNQGRVRCDLADDLGAGSAVALVFREVLFEFWLSCLLIAPFPRACLYRTGNR